MLNISRITWYLLRKGIAYEDVPAGLLPNILARAGFGGGFVYQVLVRASLAALCCAFLMLGPSATNCSSPSIKVTVKRFLWAGPCSFVSLYWCWILLNLASSFTRHIGVFSLVFAKLALVALAWHCCWFAEPSSFDSALHVCNDYHTIIKI